MEEMTNMIQASRSYEANVSALQSSKDMALSALEIAR
jgi:flagellar basal-body rod protein FlgC